MDIAAARLCDPLSEAIGLAAMPAIGQVEYLTTDGAKSERHHANFSERAKLMEPEACVGMVVMLLLLGFHTDGLLADGDAGLRNAIRSHGIPEEHMPTVHLCMNHWFRSFKDKPLKPLKAQTAPGLTGICTPQQIAQLGYNINNAAREVFPAITKAPKALTPEDCVAFRRRVILAYLWHSVGRHDKYDECHAALKELCPEATEPWCPCCIHKGCGRKEGT